jgi:glucoamylase
LISDGKSFFHDERRHLTSQIEQLSEDSLGFRLTGTNEELQYRIVKEIVVDPHHACLLIHTRLEGDESLLARLRLFALLAPHLEGGGRGNNGSVAEVAGRGLLMAHKGRTWLAMAASTPFVRRSCGYVGQSDGWTDLAKNFEMDWEFDVAEDGNIALTGELDLKGSREFTLGVAFGDSAHDAQTTLLQSLGRPFAQHRDRFVEQWQRICRQVAPCHPASGDGGALFRRSHALLLAHEDKAFPGAMIASLSIPFRGVSTRAMKIWADTIWCGRATWSTPRRRCWRPETPIRPIVR